MRRASPETRRWRPRLCARDSCAAPSRLRPIFQASQSGEAAAFDDAGTKEQLMTLARGALCRVSKVVGISRDEVNCSIARWSQLFVNSAGPPRRMLWSSFAMNSNLHECTDCGDCPKEGRPAAKKKGQVSRGREHRQNPNESVDSGLYGLFRSPARLPGLPQLGGRSTKPGTV